MRAVTQAERIKQNRTRERANREHFQSKTNAAVVNTLETNQVQPNPTANSESHLNNTGVELESNTGQMNTNQKKGAEKVQLMLTDTELDIEQVKSQSRDIRKEQVDENDTQYRNKSMKAGNESWRENTSVGNGELLKGLESTKKIVNEDALSEEEVVDNGPTKAKGKLRGRKWKLQARSTKAEKVGVNGPLNVKRPSNEISWPSPENKKEAAVKPLKTAIWRQPFKPINTSL